MLEHSAAQWMTENGFNPESIDGEGKHQDTALILACRRGEAAVVDALLAAGAAVNCRNMDGTNALWAACVADDFSIAERLLEHGADIDNQNDNGATVLMYAASNGKEPWVRFLLQAGADATLRSLDDYTALDLANTVDILRLLRADRQARN